MLGRLVHADLVIVGIAVTLAGCGDASIGSNANAGDQLRDDAASSRADALVLQYARIRSNDYECGDQFLDARVRVAGEIGELGPAGRRAVTEASVAAEYPAALVHLELAAMLGNDAFELAAAQRYSRPGGVSRVEVDAVCLLGRANCCALPVHVLDAGLASPRAAVRVAATELLQYLGDDDIARAIALLCGGYLYAPDCDDEEASARQAALVPLMERIALSRGTMSASALSDALDSSVARASPKIYARLALVHCAATAEDAAWAEASSSLRALLAWGALIEDLDWARHRLRERE